MKACSKKAYEVLKNIRVSILVNVLFVEVRTSNIWPTSLKKVLTIIVAAVVRHLLPRNVKLHISINILKNTLTH